MTYFARQIAIAATTRTPNPKAKGVQSHPCVWISGAPWPGCARQSPAKNKSGNTIRFMVIPPGAEFRSGRFTGQKRAPTCSGGRESDKFREGVSAGERERGRQHSFSISRPPDFPISRPFHLPISRSPGLTGLASFVFIQSDRNSG